MGANLSQAAAGPIKGALENFDIHNDEHAVLDYALSKDGRTGAITIRYSSPDGLPVRFSWTCTVNVDGTCTTTPLELNGMWAPGIPAVAPPVEKTVGGGLFRVRGLW